MFSKILWLVSDEDQKQECVFNALCDGNSVVQLKDLDLNQSSDVPAAVVDILSCISRVFHKTLIDTQVIAYPIPIPSQYINDVFQNICENKTLDAFF